MKLSQFKEKKNSKKIIIVAVAIIFLIGGMILEKTFANFKMQKSFKVMEGNFIYEGSGDIIFAFYKDNNQKVTNIPTIEEGYVYERSECSNNASIEWDSKKQSPIVNNLKISGTKCDLYFKKINSSSTTVSSDYNALADLIDTKRGQLAYDLTPDHNLRFVGKNPDNYVKFNNETWRIIGVMNNIEDEKGVIGSHLKIIRDSIGNYSWDSSESSVNGGYGVNEWSEADIQKVLNENYYKKEAGGTCYNGYKNTVASCPKWENIGLNDEARGMVSKIKWNTGAFYSEDIYANSSTYNSVLVYQSERSDYVGQSECTSPTDCNDKVKRNTTWTGYVGLPYVSDITLATSGSLYTSPNAVSACFGLPFRDWARSLSLSWGTLSCYSNDWLLNSSDTSNWTITPSKDYDYEGHPYSLGVIFYYAESDIIILSDVTYSSGIRPAVYLNSNVKVSGEGTKSSPYILSV